jgi:uncharacterized membrane protein YhaH (DUF805 family)
MENRSRYSHSISGIFWFDLPLGLLVCFLFHNVVKGSLISSLPGTLYGRLGKYKDFNWNKYFSSNWFKVVCCIIIGVITHFISDKVTHKSSNLVSSVPGLMETQEFSDTPTFVYRVIQVTYSIIGLALCGLTVWQLPVNRISHDSNPNSRYWLILLSIFAVTLTLIATRKNHGFTDIVVCAMTSLIVALLFTSLITFPVRKMLLARQR